MSIDDKPAGEHPTESATASRQRWMATLARAEMGELEAIFARAGRVPDHVVLKPASTGTVMIEARAGGAGRRFNLGEATVTRCFVRLQDGTVGASFALGSDKRKALLAALLDAMLQSGEGGAAFHAREIAPIADRLRRRRASVQAETARTKVDFFTLVRAEG